jgi:uncharacterized protein (DUF58 family)
MDRINNILYYVIVVLFIGWMAYFFHSYILAMMVLAMVLLPVVSFVLLRLSVKGLKISLSDNETVYSRGEVYKLKIKVSNKSFVPVLNYYFKLEMKNAFSEEAQVRYINLAVPVRGSRVVDIDIRPTLCGRIDICVADVRVRDLFSFFEKRIKLDLNSTADYRISLKVMPLKAELESEIRVAENASDEAENIGKNETGDETVDIREYNPGDSLKNIHWKLSAKKTELFVRDRGENTKDTAILLFELNADELNGVLDLVYSVLIGYCEAGQPIRLYWAGQGREQLLSYTVNNEDDILSVFERIYSCSPANGADGAVGLGTAKRQLSGGSVLYVGSVDKGVTIVDL